MSSERDRAYLHTPLWDSGKQEEERLDFLLRELTLEEKFLCMGTGCPDIPRLGIRAFHVGGEGAHGVQARHDQEFDAGAPDLTTVFPNPIGMSATWDTDLIRQAGRVTGMEARGLFSREQRGSLCLWAPTVDMERDPRWGRTEEAYGEDPYLTGEMAGAYVDGMQGEDASHLLAGATLKHFYANNVEEGRVWKSSSIDPRNREEYYLEPFRRIITEHGAVGLMTAYNEVNGVPCIVNPEIRQMAKEQWGVMHVVSDGGDMSQTVDFHHYFAQHSDTVAAGLRAGVDCFTDDLSLVQSAVKEAYETGKITDGELDGALRNHFRVMIRLGLFDPEEHNPYRSVSAACVGSSAHCQIAGQVTEEAVILLQNEPDRMGKRLLPLEQGQRIAVIGPLSDVCCKDWYSGIPPYSVTPLQGLRDHWEKERIHQESGRHIVRVRLQDGRYLGISARDRTVRAVSREEAENFWMERWDHERTTLRSCSNGLFLTTEDAFDKGQDGLVTASSQEAFGWFVKEVFLFRALQEELELCAWNGAALRWDEAGRLCVNPPDTATNSPAVGDAGYAPIERHGKSSLCVSLEWVRDGVTEAVRVAEQSDVAVLFLGQNPMINGKEEVDRTTLALPPDQQQLMEAVYAVNPKTVLVLVSSVPFAVGWAKKHLPAILTTASGSMELGNGLAKILTGEKSPSGRLPMTWYCSERDLPPMDDYDIIQGERTYQYYTEEVLYPFGHGLTYSEIQYGQYKVEWQKDYLSVHLNIRNKGTRTTDEVVQIYGRKLQPAVKRPRKQLLAFRRVKSLEPGACAEVNFRIPIRDLRYYEVIRQEKILEPGKYEIMAGASSADIRLCATVALEGSDRGIRTAGSWIPADHYDSSANAVLREGRGGYALVCTGETSEKMQLEYQQVQMAAEGKKGLFSFTLSDASATDIKLRIDEKTFACSAEASGEPDGTRRLEIPVPAGEGKEVVTVRLECGVGVEVLGLQWI